MEGIIIRKLLIVLVCVGALLAISAPAYASSGYATYYDGVMGASGDYLNSGDYHTCAVNMNWDGSPVIPFGTELGLYHNGYYSYCYVTDVGGMSWYGRTLDLHTPVFGELAPYSQGVISVDYWVISYDPGWYYSKQY